MILAGVGRACRLCGGFLKGVVAKDDPAPGAGEEPGTPTLTPLDIERVMSHEHHEENHDMPGPGLGAGPAQ